MPVTSQDKKGRKDKKLKDKKPRRIKATEFAGTVKAFKNLDALSYQKSVRE
jgi:hypothetical protein